MQLFPRRAPAICPREPSRLPGTCQEAFHRDLVLVFGPPHPFEHLRQPPRDAAVLFGGADPLGRTVTIQGVHFRVVGVSRPKGTLFGQSQDEFAVIPLGAFRRLFGNRRPLTLTARPADPADLERAMDEATVALRIARRLGPREENNFGLLTADTVLDIFNRATSGLVVVLVGVCQRKRHQRTHYQSDRFHSILPFGQLSIGS